MTRIFLLLLCFIGTAVPRALCWGNLGHEAIGQLAWEKLNSHDQAALNLIFAQAPSIYGEKQGIEAFEYASIWPDLLREGHEYGGHMNERLHIFESIGINSSNDRKCDNLHFADFDGDSLANPDDNVLTGIRLSYEALANTDSSAIQRAEAISFLAHCVGDSHQPLHVGRSVDLGGNKIHIDGLGRSHLKTNLHSVWDSGLFYGAGIHKPEQLVAAIKRAGLSNPRGNRDLKPDHWVEESHKMALESAYVDENGNQIGDEATLTEAYEEKNLPNAEERIALAAARLAGLLHQLLGNS